MRMIISVLFLAMMCGCNNPGIGGAGFDSEKNFKELENYKAYLASEVSEEIVPNKCDSVTWHAEDIFRSFSFTLPKLEGDPVNLPQYGLTASFENRVFLVKNKDKIIVKEVLPTVFYMHPIRLGIDEMNGMKILMVENDSRATTGRRFIGLYTLDGVVLYKNVLGKLYAHDINKTVNYIDIIGCNESRRITLKKTEAGPRGK